MKRWSIVALSIILLVGMVFLLGWCSRKDEVGRLKAGERVSDAQVGVVENRDANEAKKAVEDQAGRDLTESNVKAIEGASNANESAGDAGLAGQRAYCERQRVRGRGVPQWCAGL